MKKNNQSLVFHFNSNTIVETNPELVRIVLYPDYTKVDFGYVAYDKYYRGGWITIAQDTFLEVLETGERYKLQLAENIPIAPAHHYFESTKDWRYYSLLFPPIPQRDCILNIVEVEEGTSSDFNFYRIDLKMSDGIAIM